MFAAQSGSFRSYAINFLAFTPLRRLTDLDERSLEDELGSFATDSNIALAGVLAWYQRQRRALPSRYASMLALATNEAKRGVVVQRSAREVMDLFALRYRDAYGEGVLLEANANPMTLDYHAASATLARLGKRISVKLPDVIGRRGQLAKIIAIWNACVDDLKRANTAKKKSGGELTATAWAALPPDLRAQYDHPDLERWSLLERAKPIGRFSLTTLARLPPLGKPATDDLHPLSNGSWVRLRGRWVSR